MGGIFFKALGGAAAGLLAWVLWEWRFPREFNDPRWGAVELGFILTLGAFVGLTLGGIAGLQRGSRLQALRGLLIGGLIGAVGAWIGYRVAGVFLAFFPGGIFTGSYPLPLQMTARVFVMVPLGTMIGLAIGASGLTWKRALVGAIGGALGGVLAGLLFDPISAIWGRMMLDVRGGTETIVNGVPVVSGEIGQFGRAFMSLAIGLFTGLFIGIVERVVRSAWVRLVLGRNEGREWVLDAPQNFLGRDERATVPLFGDPNVAPMHACIVPQGQGYMLMDSGSPIGTLVNGLRVQQVPLTDGAHIQIGSHNLIFMLKAGAARRAAEAARAQGYAPAPVPGSPTPMHAPYVPGPVPAPSTQAQAPYVPGPTQVIPAQPAPGMPTVAQPALQALALVALDGPLVGQRVVIAGPTEIGREGAQLRLGFDSSASRRHALVSPGGPGVQIQDLGSTNGTFLNGQRVTTATAKAGDTIRIGATTFRVE